MSQIETTINPAQFRQGSNEFKLNLEQFFIILINFIILSDALNVHTVSVSSNQLKEII